MKVGSWVFDNFDVISGITFLPATTHSYRQAPYQECTEEEYEELLQAMPKDLDWDALKRFEDDDEYASKSVREYSCVGSSCELVDITNGN